MSERKPWNPCTDCIDPLRSEYEQIAWEFRPRHPFRSLAEISLLYHFHDFQACEQWLEFNLSPAYAEVFRRRVMAPAIAFHRWDTDLQNRKLIESEAEDEYRAVQNTFAEAAKYLSMLSVMLAAKIDRASPVAQADTFRQHRVRLVMAAEIMECDPDTIRRRLKKNKLPVYKSPERTNAEEADVASIVDAFESDPAWIGRLQKLKNHPASNKQTPTNQR